MAHGPERDPQVTMKIRDLYSDPSNWTPGGFARNAAGDLVWLPLMDTAVCWCLGGAIHACYPNPTEQDAIYDRIARHLKSRMPPACRVVEDHSNVHMWNDSATRTFAEVKAVVEELDI